VKQSGKGREELKIDTEYPKSLSMPPDRVRSADRIVLTVPVIFLVLAATAIPIGFRPLREAELSFSVDDASDIIANIIGYLPVGIVLGRLGILKAVFIAGLISTFAEVSQVFMLHRDPSIIDVASNLVGAMLGSLASARWNIGSPAFRVTRSKAALAVLLALSLLVGVWAGRGDPVNARGDTSPGTLEAHWKLDESGGSAVLDYSGHELLGKFHKEPKRIAGVMGNAPVFDGANYIDFGHSTGLRLARSMTISAWINSNSFPVDDAAIVSQLRDRGYQLDTTIDRGPRTIGFKLTDACGKLMARYGATPLVLNTWYHVAGVYDAAAETLDVYLNGELDNGFLLGSVSSVQTNSRRAVYVGRKGGSSKFNFSGLINGVRIYSFALTKSQIAADMRGEMVHADVILKNADHPPCAPYSDPEDKEIPAAAAALGTLVAVVCIGIWPSNSRLHVLGVSLAAGFLLLLVAPPNLPAFNIWLLPLVTLGGAASVAVSVRPPC
jgi:VanZ family protein